jgi:hypothetical protein
MAYIEQDDSTPVSSNTAAQIRHFARSIWIGFRTRGQAPKTWGEAPRELRDDYIREMETHWDVLRYCENHWKADAIATAVYSPWYNGPLKKANANKNQTNITEERATKRAKMAGDNIDKDHAPGPRVQASASGTAPPENPILDLGNTPSLGVELDVQQMSGKAGSKPKARPVARKDPL